MSFHHAKDLSVRKKFNNNSLQSSSVIWEMKFGKKEIIKKLDQCQALFQINLLVTKDFWR